MDLYILCILFGMLIVIVLLIIILIKPKNDTDLKLEIANNIKNMSDLISNMQNTRLKEVNENLKSFEERLNVFSISNEKKLESIRDTVENRLSKMQEDNGQKLEKMRETVDEKLQKTLEERIGKSFELVSKRLQEVYEGLGEMKNLAAGVGDLKKVLSNVKTRGILGEYQLSSILEQIFSKEQYDENVYVKKDSRDVVEFAIKLPGDDNGTIYLPIDAKFPIEAYNNLMDAYDTSDVKLIENAKSALDKRIKQCAKDIRDKYISPPQTTDFAIMFLPTEGLYAEVIRHNLIEVLQRDYKVNVAGPTTIAAFLQSLQMGFKTLAIQKRSSEVWDILGTVRNEFDKFENVIKLTQQRLEQANVELEKLVGVRTRAIKRQLAKVSSLPEEEPLLEDE